MLWALFYLLLLFWLAATYTSYLFEGWIHLLLAGCAVILVVKLLAGPRGFR